MTDHTIEAHFVVDANTINAMQTLTEQTFHWTFHFRNYDITPEGYLHIKNFHPDFRDKLAAVLNDDKVEFLGK